MPVPVEVRPTRIDTLAKGLNSWPRDEVRRGWSSSSIDAIFAGQPLLVGRLNMENEPNHTRNHTRRLLLYATLVASVLLTSCSHMFSMPDPHLTDDPTAEGKHRWAIFFDGTNNDENSSTNVLALFQMLDRSRNDTGAIYIEGVGAKGKPIGMALSWGLGHRVRVAYRYLAKRYRKGDEVYIFGFSRGAYSARILASLLYHAGLPDEPSDAVAEDALISKIYDGFKGDKSSSARVLDVKGVLDGLAVPSFSQVDVQIMGLWDTVEALGFPNYEENENVPNPRYGDQLCNVKNAYQALSLDDNRAQIFTPIMLTRNHLLADCKRGKGTPASHEVTAAAVRSKVEEVYFPGAHSDVGGGYAESPLKYFSRKWMHDKSSVQHLFQRCKECASGNAQGLSHDPQAEFPFNIFYKRLYRSIDRYASHKESTSDVVLFHQSIVERLAILDRASHAFEYGGSDEKAQKRIRRAGKNERLSACFDRKDHGDGRATYTLPVLTKKPGCLLKIVRHDGLIVEPVQSALGTENESK